MRSSGADWWEIGGGANLWFSDKLGTVVEFRDYIHREDENDSVQFWAVRFGITWKD
jgi:hypothetical protein